MVNEIRIINPLGINKGFQTKKAEICLDRNIVNITIKMKTIFWILYIIKLSRFNSDIYTNNKPEIHIPHTHARTHTYESVLIYYWVMKSVQLYQETYLLFHIFNQLFYSFGVFFISFFNRPFFISFFNRPFFFFLD